MVHFYIRKKQTTNGRVSSELKHVFGMLGAPVQNFASNYYLKPFYPLKLIPVQINTINLQVCITKKICVNLCRHQYLF